MSLLGVVPDFCLYGSLDVLVLLPDGLELVERSRKVVVLLVGDKLGTGEATVRILLYPTS